MKELALKATPQVTQLMAQLSRVMRASKPALQTGQTTRTMEEPPEM